MRVREVYKTVAAHVDLVVVLTPSVSLPAYTIVPPCPSSPAVTTATSLLFSELIVDRSSVGVVH